MSIDKNKIKTQDELNEAAPMDEADERAKAEMRELEDQAKKDVRAWERANLGAAPSKSAAH